MLVCCISITIRDQSFLRVFSINHLPGLLRDASVLQLNVKLMVDAEHSYFQPAIGGEFLTLSYVFVTHSWTCDHTQMKFLNERRSLCPYYSTVLPLKMHGSFQQHSCLNFCVLQIMQWQSFSRSTTKRKQSSTIPISAT